MANDIIISNSGAGGVASVPEQLPGSVAQHDGVASRTPQPASRKAEIEAIMRTDFDRYDRDYRNEYQQILEDELAGADPDSGNPTRPMAVDVSRASLCGSAAGQRLVMDWERMGGFGTHLANVQRTAGEIVRSVGGNREQRVFLENFSREVSTDAEAAIMDELATGAPSFVLPASDGEVKLFASTQAGKEMVAEWGIHAPDKVAQIRQRAQRLTTTMSAEDAEDFWFWFEGLDVATVKNIYKRMVR